MKNKVKIINKQNYFELAPVSEQTLKKHKYYYMGAEFVNDLGYPCEYRILVNGMDDISHELGMIKYYKGRKLACYELRRKRV